MKVYIVLIQEDDWETSKEYFGVFTSKSSCLKELSGVFEDCLPNSFEQISKDTIRTRYSLDHKCVHKSYHIYIYADEVN